MFKRGYFLFQLIVLALAQCLVWPAGADDIPSLIGDWRGEYTVQSRQGRSSAEVHFAITEQEGALFKGAYEWEYHPDTPVVGDHEAGVGKRGKDVLLGVIGWDNTSINIADVDDKGLWFGKLTGPDTLELIYVESQDHATVSRTRLVRHPATKKAP